MGCFFSCFRVGGGVSQPEAVVRCNCSQFSSLFISDEKDDQYALEAMVKEKHDNVISAHELDITELKQQVDTTSIVDEISEPAAKEVDKVLLLSKQLGNDGNIPSETASHSEEPEGVTINLQAEQSGKTISEDVIISPLVDKDVGDNDGKKKSYTSNNTSDVDEGKNSAMFDQEEDGALVVPQQPSSSTLVLLSNDKENIDTGEGMKLDLTKQKKAGNNLDEMSIRQLSKKLKQFYLDHSQQVEEHQDDNGAETFLVMPQKPSSSTLVRFSNDKENIDTREGMKLDLTKQKKAGNNLDEMSIGQLCKKLKQSNPYHSQQVEEHEEDDDGAPPFRARNSKKQKWRKGRKALGARGTAENRPALQQVPHNSCMGGNSKTSSH